MKDTITLNHMVFEEKEDCKYKNDYIKIVKDLKKASFDKTQYVLRRLVEEDLFFIVFFVQQIQVANHDFVIRACQDVEEGPSTKTLDVWARFHFKSTIITIAETVQYHLKYPDRCSCLFSYKAGAAQRFLGSIRSIYESNFLKKLFPDKLFDNPATQSISWSLLNGITIKRARNSRPEKTIQASGLVEGMVQGSHFERRIYDDIETNDMKYSQEQQDRCYEQFVMSSNLGTQGDDDIERLVGTYYSHTGPLVRLRDSVDLYGQPIYKYRKKAVTHDGTIDGIPVLVSEEKFVELKKKETFYSQQLCDPTPRQEALLEPSLLKEVNSVDIPKNIYRFMIIDPAGSFAKRGSYKRNDNWAVHVIGVEPKADEIGASNIYIIDSYIDKCNESEIVFQLNNMYWRNALIDQVAYEQTGGVTPGWMVHFKNALQARGAILSQKTGNLVILSPKSQEKKNRITSALRLPLLNGKIHFSSDIEEEYIGQLKKEMELHPVWHDDGIDALAYIYQVMENYGMHWRISAHEIPMELDTPKSPTDNSSNSWLGV